MINNKRGQFLVDATDAPKWILYPLLILICLLLLVVIVVMILFIISWIRGDAQFVPFGMFGYYGMPIMMGSFHSSSSSVASECFTNGIRVACSNYTGAS